MKKLLFIILISIWAVNRLSAQTYTINTMTTISEPLGVAIDDSDNIYIASYGNYVSKLNTKGILSIIAGNGTGGYNGDGIAATSAELYHPSGIAIDVLGNLYIADVVNFRIRKVNTNGIISTVAGNGTPGYSGDGGSATSAQLYFPNGVAVDDSGNLYIADYENNVIRKVNKSGIISTIAGNGTNGYSGDNGLATSAELDNPSEVVVDDSDNLFITDQGNNVIRKINKSGIITKFAGWPGIASYNGDDIYAQWAYLNGPSGISVDNSGNVYIVDEHNNRVRKVDKRGIIPTIAGNGTNGFSGDNGSATIAELNYPVDVVKNSSGNMFISDEGNGRIRKLTVCPNSVITVTPPIDSICSGQSVTLIASPANNNYTWSPSSELNTTTGYSVVLTATYYITSYTNIYSINTPNDSLGCSSTGIAIVTVNPSPTLSISNDTSINLGDSVQLSATSSNYPEIWSPSTGLSCTNCSNPIANPTITTTYICTATQGSCDISDTVIITVKTSTAINQVSVNNNQISIYPNPSSGQFSIQLNDNKNNYTVEIYNVMGEKIYQSFISNSQNSIDISSQPTGVYFIYLKSEKDIKVGKALITK